MRSKKYQEFGGTTACTLRLVDTAMEYDFYPIEEDNESEEEEADVPETNNGLFIGDSWFGSVKCCAQVAKKGQHAILQIKTNYARSPKK